MSSDENTEVNVEVIGGAPELWVIRSAVIVTNVGVVSVTVVPGVCLGCCGFGCGDGGLVVVVVVVDDVGLLEVVVVVDDSIGDGVGVVTKQRKEVWSAIDR